MSNHRRFTLIISTEGTNVRETFVILTLDPLTRIIKWALIVRAITVRIVGLCIVLTVLLIQVVQDHYLCT